MPTKMLINNPSAAIEYLPLLSKDGLMTDILRIDRIHPVISGNKWFKLHPYLADALAKAHKTVASFGGAYSNHIVALAYAGQAMGLQTVGYIRGDESVPRSHTLMAAARYGMQLVFVDRSTYQQKNQWMLEAGEDYYWIPEGGYGLLGANGASGILQAANTHPYTHIICAAGTGTMMAGLIKAAGNHQHVCGISVLKNNRALAPAVMDLLDASEKLKSHSFHHDFHFGGYAKHTPALLAFMQQLWQVQALPTDFVYTAKMLYAVQSLLAENYFPSGSRLLLIHSGGLQGNDSLPKGILPF